MVNPAAKLQMKLSESEFPFSKRMHNFFRWVEIDTVAELAAIPLVRLTCFKGFKSKCREELIAFIEFEGIGTLFEGYLLWKEQQLHR